VTSAGAHDFVPEIGTIHKERRAEVMTYEKPEVTYLGDALNAIQNLMAKTAGSIDSQGTLGRVTVPAYDADE
jgi:hypothetical protein